MLGANAHTEAMLNRLLRRVDWRFLLPDPQPAKSICFADSWLAQSVAAISQQVVELPAQAGNDCTLAVMVDPDEATLHTAWNALESGGACYSEWNEWNEWRHPSSRGPRSVRRRLEAAGFVDVTCYWPWPSPDRSSPLFWLPMEAPKALDYFLANRPHAHSQWRRTWNGALRVLWRAALSARLLSPICAVARKPDASAASPGWLDTVRSQWPVIEPDSIPKHIDLLLLSGGNSSSNKLVCLVFVDAQPIPKMAVKLPRVSDSVPALEREAVNLQAIQLTRAGAVPGVPRVIFFRDCARLPVLAETVLTGRPLSVLARRGNYREMALKVTDWLVDLANRPKARPRAEWWDRLVESALIDFERCFGAALDSDRLHDTRIILDALGDLPLVCEQRDCSPWNVLISPTGDVVVLDWESAELRGLPALDLIYFLTYLAFFVDGAMESKRFRESYRATLDPATFTGHVVAECLDRYFKQLGLPADVLPPLRLLTWLIHSRSEYRRLAADAAGLPNTEALCNSLFVKLWTEELHHRARA